MKILPIRGLKNVGYYVKVGEGKRYKIWHYYMWVEGKWRLIPHRLWCAVATMLHDIYKLEDIVTTEEYELIK